MSAADSVNVGAFLASQGLVNIGQFTGLALGPGMRAAAQGNNLALDVNAPDGFLGDVPNLAALTASDDGTDNVQRRVTTLLQSFVLDKTSTATIDGITVVATLSGVGRWLRNLEPVARWTNQLTWTVDPTLGNDENDGSVLTPVKTLAETSRRLQAMNFAAAGYTINVLGNIPATDTPRWNPWITTLGNGVANGAFQAVLSIAINGVRTPIVTSAVVAYSVTVPATNTQATITDGTVTWATHIGKMIVITSGAQTGAVAWILKDLGAGVARVSELIFAPTRVLAAAPAPGDTYQIVDLTTFAPLFAFAGQSNKVFVNFNNFDFITGGGIALCDVVAQCVTCRFSGGAGTVSIVKNFIGVFAACGFVSATIQRRSVVEWSRIALNGCGLINWQLASRRSGDMNVQNTVLQAGYLSVGFQDTAGDAATQAMGGILEIAGTRGVGVFDSPATFAASNVNRLGQMIVRVPLYGSGNATFGMDVKEGGSVLVHSTVTPTITGTSGDVQLESAATAIPELVAGAAVPAASALTTWANWTAAPFTRNVMSYKTGSRILNVTG